MYVILSLFICYRILENKNLAIANMLVLDIA